MRPGTRIRVGIRRLGAVEDVVGANVQEPHISFAACRGQALGQVTVGLEGRCRVLGELDRRGCLLAALAR